MRTKLRKADALAKANKLERAFADVLEAAKQGGEIVWWDFEPLKLRLAASTFYTPDFAALRADGQMVLYETKGFWRDDARVKIKVAARAFPMFRFVAVQRRPKKEGGGWNAETIPAYPGEVKV